MNDVPFVWYCMILSKLIHVNGDAVSFGDGGFVCDCGRIVSGSDGLHKVMRFNDVFSVDELNFLDISKVDVVIRSRLVLPVVGVKCCECGHHFDAFHSVELSNGDILLYDVVKCNGHDRIIPLICRINDVWICDSCYYILNLDKWFIKDIRF